MTTKTPPAAGAAATKELSIDDLQPADILLSKGHGFVSDLIAESDGGQYSHGALWSGMSIIQATGDGITESELHGRHGVYRYQPALPEQVAEEIVAIATKQVDGRYAYGELVMLGALFLSGIRVKGALLNRLLDAIGGPTASKLKAWLDEHAGKSARVCTELVASAYYEAAGGAYALRVRSRPPAAAVVRAATPQATRGGPPLTSGLALAVDDAQLQPTAIAAAQSCLDLLIQKDLNPSPGTRKLLAGALARDAVTGAPMGVVTPADLEFSPSLQFVGRLNA
jgi:hypothetical protein